MRLMRLLQVVLTTGTVLAGPMSVASAQTPAAPVPIVSLTGQIDTVTSASQNFRDVNFTRAGDKEWYTRNRGLVFLTGQVGTALATLGLEIDTAWGQVSGSDNNVVTGAAAIGTAQRVGTTSAFDLNTDTQGSIEVKWLYVEYDVPLVPFPTRMRLGAQPFAATYKGGVLASGDFAGVYLSTTFTPVVKAHFTFVQIEEELTGGGTGGTGATAFTRGDDFAVITSIEVAPVKGLDIRPVYALAWLQGATSGAARQAVGGILGAGGTPTFAAKPVGAGGVATHQEWRHTIGADARWRSGPVSVEPTFFYQFGAREVDNPFTDPTHLIRSSTISAWLVDVKGGYRIGPLFLEARYMYTSGNRPKDQLSQDTNYFQPIDTDTGFWADGWGNILAKGVDNVIGAPRTLSSGIGWDRYGRQQFGFKATYSATPALDVWGLVSPAWTARSLSADGPFSAAAVNCATHSANSAATPRGAGCDGNESYLGTELNLGLTWRFAPGLAFDVVGAYLFSGAALDTSEAVGGVLTRRSAAGISTAVARVRFSF